MKLKKALFLHHGNGASGADMSLLYLMRGLKINGVECTVACVKDEGGAVFFQSEGFKVIQCRAKFFSHTYGGWYVLWKPSGVFYMIAWWLQYKTACNSIAKVIDTVKPEIVHLNSLTLAPYLPVVSSRRLPAILHVRERVHPGSFGIRKKWLKNIVIQHASSVIYICKDNRDHFIGNHFVGRVVYNPVDFSIFNKDLRSVETKKRLGLTDETKVILFLGGSGLRIKGIIPLLESIHVLKQRIPEFKCIMLGASMSASSRFIAVVKRNCANLLGMYSLRQQMARIVRKYAIEDEVVFLPFTRNVETFYAIANVVVVPFTQPHFARQIIEAGAMAKPVVASKIGGIEEVVIDRKTGILVRPGDANAIADGIAEIILNTEAGLKMGNEAFMIAKAKYDVNVSVKQIYEIFTSLL